MVGTFHAAGDQRRLPVARARGLRGWPGGSDVRCAVSDDARPWPPHRSAAHYELLLNGIEVERFADAEPGPTDGPTMLFLGRHEPRKGLEVLLAALAVPARRRAALGGGRRAPTRRGSSAASRRRPPDRVARPHQRRREGGAGCGARRFCAPRCGASRSAMVLLEAMAAGTRARGQRPARLPQRGHRRGRRPPGPAGRPGALAKALRRVLEEPALRACLSPREPAAGRPAGRWRTSLDRYAAIYGGLAAGRVCLTVSNPRSEAWHDRSSSWWSCGAGRHLRAGPPTTGSSGRKNQIDNAWAQIDVQLKRRHDLIPNLVETVKGYAAHEKRHARGGRPGPGNAVDRPGHRHGPDGPGRERQITGALQVAVRPVRGVPGPQGQPELPGAAGGADRHRGPHRLRPAVLQRHRPAATTPRSRLPDERARPRARVQAARVLRGGSRRGHRAGQLRQQRRHPAACSSPAAPAPDPACTTSPCQQARARSCSSSASWLLVVVGLRRARPAARLRHRRPRHRASWSPARWRPSPTGSPTPSRWPSAGPSRPDAEEYPRLHNLVEGLCIAAGLPKPRVYIVDDVAPNAFATGRNPKHAAIAVTTGLLEKMNRVELEGVLAHEL